MWPSKCNILLFTEKILWPQICVIWIDLLAVANKLLTTIVRLMGKVLKRFWAVKCNFALLMSPRFVTENNKMTTKLDLIKHINQLCSVSRYSKYIHTLICMFIIKISASISITGKLQRNTDRVMGFSKSPLRNCSVCF